MVKTIVVSACLLGACCRYDGHVFIDEDVKAYCEGAQVLKVCPEMRGGLQTPRHPCEVRVGRVINTIGEDLSDAFIKGAQSVLEQAQQHQCTHAILKSRSPSCGCGRIYDGHFSKTLIMGDGVCAALLKKHGINVCSEEDIKEIRCGVRKHKNCQ